MTIYFPEFLGWNLLSSRFLIGTYYGILATLPLAPSQLLSIRVLLLEDENKQGKIVGAGAAKGIFIAGISGFLVAQFAMFLSIYCSPLYTLWFKPHLLNLLLPPLLFWHYSKIVEFDPVAHLIPNYKHPWLDPRVRMTFLESFLFQIMNPIVLPNPVFTRLISLFLFRYSHIPMFVFGSLLGWLSGQLLFIVLSRMLLSRLQIDALTIYRIVRRIVHLAFPPIMIGIWLSYIGRDTMTPLYTIPDTKNNLSLSNLWPDAFYNRDRVSCSTHFMLSSHQSPLRQPNAPFNILNVPFHKSHFSQYFFDICISDGKRRLIHNYPISLSVIQSDLTKLLKINKNSNTLFQEWANRKEVRLIRFNEIIKNKISNLDRGIEDTIEKRLNSISEMTLDLTNALEDIEINEKCPTEFSEFIRKYMDSDFDLDRIRHSYDTRLRITSGNNSMQHRYESPWFMDPDVDLVTSRAQKRNYLARWEVGKKRLNRLKKIISKINITNLYFDLSKKIPIWKSRSKASSFYFEFEFFTENITRRKRKKFFVRSFVQGAVYGKSRNIAGIFQLFETKPHSSFFLRAKEIKIDSRKNLNDKERLSQTEAEKFDFSNSHTIRGPALVAQSYIRRYIKLPALILGKTLIRLFLLQSSELQQDLAEWNQEEYIYCFYDCNHVPDNKIPTHWLLDGMQIKILSTFYVAPWRPSLKYDKNIRVKNTLDKINARSTYINIWGQVTDVPFGEVQRPPFLKPIIKGLILLWRYQLAKLLRILNRISLYVKKKCNFIKIPVHQWIRISDKKTERNHFNVQKIDKKSVLGIDTHSHETINEMSQNKLNQNNDQDQIQGDYFVKNKNISQKNINELNTIIFKSIHSDITYQKKDYLTKQKLSIELNVKYKKLSIFPIHLITKKPQKFLEYQKIRIHILIIHLYQKWVVLRKSIFRFIISFIRISKRKQLQMQRLFFKLIRGILLFCNEQTYKTKIRFIILIKFRTLLETKANSDILSMVDDYPCGKDGHSLSHAYILHKIWQSNIPNRLCINKLLMDWQPENALQDHLKIILKKQGLFNNQNPQDINLDNFKEWLRPFRRYTPSPAIWHQISPHIWRKIVNEFWVNNNIDIDNFQYRKKTYKYSRYSRYLSFYKPLFGKVKKMSKRWQFNLLTNTYTDSLKNGNLYDLLAGWRNENREQTQAFRLNLIHEKYPLTQNILSSKKIVWGLANTRYKRLHPSFSLDQSFNKDFSSIDNIIDIPQTTPMYDKYQLMYYMLNKKPFEDRNSFPCIMHYRWKSEKQRLRGVNSIDTIQKVKSDLKKTLEKGVIAKNKKLKSVPFYMKRVRELALQWMRIAKTKFTVRRRRKRQARILDDELIANSLISSFLRFKNRYLNNQNLGLLDPSFDQFILTNKFSLNSSCLIPEDILLPKSLREFRILSSLRFDSESNALDLSKTQNLDELKQNTENGQDMDISYLSTQSQIALDELKQKNSNQIIKRYIWPTYRIEDLACMNRFWISTANQGRFSSLRIRMYPNFFE